MAATNAHKTKTNLAIGVNTQVRETFSREVRISRMIYVLLKGLGLGLGIFGGLIGYLR